jgi:phage-related baseplate assembly protein
MTALPDLQAPDVVETLGYEAVLAELVGAFRTRYPQFTALLESDPAIKLLEVAAYRELLLRQRINDAARANLLAFAGTTDLDHLALFYGVERLNGEEDTALRARVQARIAGWSTGGTVPGYRYHALSTHPGIEDAAVASPEPGLVVVSLLPRTGADADAALGAATARLQDPSVRVLTDTIEVRLATAVTIDVAARVWLRPDTQAGRLAEIESELRATFAVERALGWDVTRSWVVARLHRTGVHRVEVDQPAIDASVPSDGYPVLGDVELTLAGRGY